MAKDKYTAVWVSHSSISDYLKCPRAYYLNNIYRDPKTNHKVNLMQPPLALGQVVHDVLESLSILPVEKRFDNSIFTLFEEKWATVSGVNGGFVSPEEEQRFKNRGKTMLQRVIDHPGPLQQKAVKLRQELPYYWLSEEHNIILCGKIDWLEYIEKNDSVRIVDFKTGKHDEDPDSLQLPIYYLLALHCQTRPVEGISYWYIERDDQPTALQLPEESEATQRVLEIAKRIMVARKLNQFTCRNGNDGCFACKPLEKIISGEAKFVGVGTYNQDIYVLNG